MKNLSPFAYIAIAFTCLLMARQQAVGGDDAAWRIVYLSNRAGVSRTFDIFVHDTAAKEVCITARRSGLGITSLSAPKLLAKRNSVVCFGSGGKSLLEIPIGKGDVRVIAKLTQGSGQLAAAPDGQALLYTDRINGKTQLFEVDLRRGTIRNLSSNPWNNSEGSYSSDGNRIVYVSDQDSSLSIAMMERDGSHQKILTNNFGDDRFPHFSPDGKTVVFTSSRSALHEMQYDLYAIDTSGRKFELLYSNGAYNASPVFSPDGKEVLFVSTNMTKKSGLVLLLDRASGAVSNVTAGLKLLSQNASYSNDGCYVLFEHNTIRDCEIMLWDRQSRSMKNVSQNPAWDCSPSF